MQTSNHRISLTDLQGGRTYWRALYYFNLYRLLLGTGMLTLAVTGSRFALLGNHDRTLFLGASAAMLTVAILSLISITVSWPAFRIQAYLQFGLDALLITALSHASGGLNSGLNLLLIASIAAGGVVLSGRMSLFFAAFATVLALVQQSVELLLSPGVRDASAFFQVGLLGIGYFSTGLIVYWLAKGFHAMEADAQIKTAITARLNRLNEAIVSNSTIGIAVIDKNRHCRLLNDRARQMLGLPRAAANDLPPALIGQAVEAAAHHANFTLDYKSPVTPIRVQGLRLDDEDHELALFLDDLALAERRARNLKLAALGRLTASVAHEIRNPLAAISHAGQLLAEAPELSDQSRELTRIVDKQSDRIDTIVESILQLGKPGSVVRTSLEIEPWLEQFRKAFNQNAGIKDALRVESEALSAQVNSDQLHQILTNLCENALRQTRNLPDRPLISVRGFAEPGSGAVCLDVFDSGSGIPEAIQDKIFEPFFTTHHQGVGLGLFLARELAENNHGSLEYLYRDQDGRFRLTLEAALPAHANREAWAIHG